MRAGTRLRTITTMKYFIRRLAMRAAPQGSASPSPTIATRSGSATSPAASSPPSTPARYGRSDDLAWSPDGAWLAYTFAPARATSRSSCYEVAGDSRTWSPSPSSATPAPAFDPEGTYLYFLSVRTFDPVYDSVHFDLSFPRGARPYLIALQAPAAGRRSIPSRAAWAASRERDAASGRRRREPRPRRRCASTSTASPAASPPSRSPRTATAGSPASPAQGRLERENIVGAHGRGGHKEAAGKLERFDFATGRTDTLAEKVDDFALRAMARRWSIAKARRCARSPPTDRPDQARPGRRRRRALAQERLDRPRAAAHRGRAAARVAADAARGLAPAARPVLVGRACRASTGTRSGASTRRWSSVWRRGADLSDLVWEMQGELGTSHAYEMGGDHRKPPRWRSATSPASCAWTRRTAAAIGHVVFYSFSVLQPGTAGLCRPARDRRLRGSRAAPRRNPSGRGSPRPRQRPASSQH